MGGKEQEMVVGQGGDCPGQWVMNFPEWLMFCLRVHMEPDLYMFSEARVVL